MAGGIGKTGSFVTDTPLVNNIAPALQEVENNGFKYRAEQYTKQKAAKDAVDAEDKETAAALEKVKSDTTNYQSHNAMVIDNLSKLRDGIGNKYRDYKSGRISKTDYEIAKNNAIGQAALFDQASKRINEQAKNYAAEAKDGKIPSMFVDEAMKFGGAVDQNNIHFELQPDLTFKAMVYDKSDPNNPKILEQGDLSTIGTNAFTPVYNYDFDKSRKEFLNDYPKVMTESYNGAMKTGKKGITPQIENAIGLQVDKVMADPNAMAIMASKLAGRPVREVKDPQMLETIKNNLTKEYKDMYSTETTKDRDTGFLNYQQRAYEFGVGQDEKNLHPGLKEVTNVKNDTEIELDGKKYKVPAGSKDIAAMDFLKGGYEAKKKGIYEGVQKFRVVTGKDGKSRVLALIENFGKDTEGTTTKTVNEKGLEYIKDYMKKNPKATEETARFNLKQYYPEGFTDVRGGTKENPSRWMNIGRNQTEFSQYLPENITTDEIVRQVLKMAGQNPNTAAKGNVKKNKVKTKSVKGKTYGGVDDNGNIIWT